MSKAVEGDGGESDLVSGADLSPDLNEFAKENLQNMLAQDAEGGHLSNKAARRSNVINPRLL